MDGLLLDSERLARRTFISACRSVGWEPDLAVYDLCIGSTYQATERILKAGFGSDFPFQAIIERWDVLYQEHIAHQPVDVKSGALELLRRLDELGIPRALATSTRRRTALTKLRNAALDGFFATMVCGGETARGKPHPDPYLEAAQRLGLDPGQCWALEDSNNGVCAAQSAGFCVFQIPDLVAPSAEIRALGHRIVSSLFDVLNLLGALCPHTSDHT
ncbi:MAG: HAD family phosphatase [Gammaproteobacteria bacterium]|nr:HAD family phosphatase [Gammaproteobacteria bacterium]